MLDFDGRHSYARVDSARFIKMLGLFIRGHAQSAQTLREAIDNNDAEPVRQIAHKLKGTSDFIGAHRLAEHAAALGPALKGQEPWHEGARELVRLLEATLDEATRCKKAMETEVTPLA